MHVISVVRSLLKKGTYVSIHALMAISVKCGQCGAMFRWHYMYYKHLREVHGIRSEKEGETMNMNY